MATKEIRLLNIDSVSPGHYSPGLWSHPRDRSGAYTDIGYWVDLAKTLEKGKFDALFLADNLSVHDVYGGNHKASIPRAANTPILDPMVFGSAMAPHTPHL